jgi:hypothetical protein
MIVWCASLVAINSHETVSLTVSNLNSVRAINWNLLIVDTESVAVGIRIGEKSSLKHLVFRRLNTWDEVAWSESGLFGFSEVVFRVSV